jgi:hypothetical protein
MRQFDKDPSYQKIYELCVNSIRYSIKIAFDIYSLEGTLENLKEQDILENIYENLSKSYLGTGSEFGWRVACDKNFESLWNLQYKESENTAITFRSYYKPIVCRLF